MDKFGVVRTISKEVKTPCQSRGFAIMTNSEPRTGQSRNKGLGNALADPEVDNEKTSRQRVKARISTSTKLLGTDRVTPPLVTPLVDNGAALEEALNNPVDSRGEQNEQMSIRMSELERAVHNERESLREEINCNRQEVGRSEKRLQERTDEHMAKNLSRLTREAEQRELRLRDDMEKLRIQQEQSLGTHDTKIDAMMERRTQAIMDRLDGLQGSKSGQKKGEPNSGGPSREPKVNFNDYQRGEHMDPLEVGAVHQAMSQGIIEHGARTVEQVQRGTDRPLTNDQRKAHMRLGEVIPVTGDMRAQGGVMWTKGETLTAIRIAGMRRIQSL